MFYTLHRMHLPRSGVNAFLKQTKGHCQHGDARPEAKNFYQALRPSKIGRFVSEGPLDSNLHRAEINHPAIPYLRLDCPLSITGKWRECRKAQSQSNQHS